MRVHADPDRQPCFPAVTGSFFRKFRLFLGQCMVCSYKMLFFPAGDIIIYIGYSSPTKICQNQSAPEFARILQQSWHTTIFVKLSQLCAKYTNITDTKLFVLVDGQFRST